MADAKIVIPQKQPTPPVSEKESEEFVAPESVKVKNISKNAIPGINGLVDPGKVGYITFSDFCNFSPTYVEKV